MKSETFLPWIIGAIVVYLILKNASGQSPSTTGQAVSTGGGSAPASSSSLGDIGNEVGLLN